MILKITWISHNFLLLLELFLLILYILFLSCNFLSFFCFPFLFFLIYKLLLYFSFSLKKKFHVNYTKQHVLCPRFWFWKYFIKKIPKNSRYYLFFWFCPKCIKKRIYLFLPSHISMFVFLRMNSVDIYLIFAYRDFHGEGVTVTSSWIALTWYSELRIAFILNIWGVNTF